MEEQKLLKHVCKFCKKRFVCGRSLGGHIRCHLPKPGYDQGDMMLKSSASSSEIDMENLRMTNKVNQGNCKSKKVCIVGGNNNNNNNSHSSISEVVEEEQLHEEVDIALCLIMLSKDVGPWGEGKNCEGKKSKKKRKRAVKVMNFTAMPESQHQGLSQIDQLNRDDFSSPYPNEVFNNICLGSSSTFSKKIVKKHECSICLRVFSSGQALGGHKRSHLLGSNQRIKTIDVVQRSSSSETRDVTIDIIDLNLPAVIHVQEEVNRLNTTITTLSSSNSLMGVIKPRWWVKNPLKHEAF